MQRLTHRTLELLRELEEANARTSQAQDASVLLTDELSAARGEGAALVKKLAAAERAAAAAQGEAAAAARECAALRKQSEAAQERAAEFKAVAVAAEESGAALEARAEAAEDPEEGVLQALVLLAVGRHVPLEQTRKTKLGIALDMETRRFLMTKKRDEKSSLYTCKIEWKKSVFPRTRRRRRSTPAGSRSCPSRTCHRSNT